jgi:hypothetical protein
MTIKNLWKREFLVMFQLDPGTLLVPGVYKVDMSSYTVRIPISLFLMRPRPQISLIISLF